MVSIRSLPLLAIVAIVASVSAVPVIEPPTQVEAAALAAAAAGTFPPVGYPHCSTRPKDYMRCWEWCGKKGYWYTEPDCCCP
ncbi:hypothetical protein MVEG_00041 [Podila verticillata NRRL 6337]|nr:hypothetical protein MVEG_00041 [Podila verticillata NRRL 6337]